MKNFKFVVYFTLSFFMSMLVFVTVTAYQRKSGNTGLDMGKIHLIRPGADKTVAEEP